MADIRDKKLAEILVNYSTKVQPGDWVHIRIASAAIPLAREVLIAVLEAGGNPTYTMRADTLSEAFMSYASDEQIAHPEPLELHLIKNMKSWIILDAPENTRAMSGIDPARLSSRQVANKEWIKMYTSRSASKDLGWVMTQYPTNSYAQDAGMSLTDYQDFVYCACFADQEDHLGAWQKIRNVGPETEYPNVLCQSRVQYGLSEHGGVVGVCLR